MWRARIADDYDSLVYWYGRNTPFLSTTSVHLPHHMPSCLPVLASSPTSSHLALSALGISYLIFALLSTHQVLSTHSFSSLCWDSACPDIVWLPHLLQILTQRLPSQLEGLHSSVATLALLSQCLSHSLLILFPSSHHYLTCPVICSCYFIHYMSAPSH